jgi:hypothetical protein
VAGREGFVAGRVVAVLAALVVRARYVRRMLPGVRLADLAAPAFRAGAVAVLAVVALRVVLWGGERPLWQALAELAIFAAVFARIALRSERPLLAELRGGLRPVAPMADLQGVKDAVRRAALRPGGCCACRSGSARGCAWRSSRTGRSHLRRDAELELAPHVLRAVAPGVVCFDVGGPRRVLRARLRPALRRPSRLVRGRSRRRRADAAQPRAQPRP